MKVNRLEISITNFDNAVMADDPTAEVVTILKGLIGAFEKNSIPACDGRGLRDSNGNTVGKVVVDFDEPEDDDDDEEFDDDDTDDGV